MSCPGGTGGIVLTALEHQALELNFYPIIHDQVTVKENRPFQLITSTGNSMKVNTNKVLTRGHLGNKHRKLFSYYNQNTNQHFNPLMDDSIDETRSVTEITKGFEFNEAHCLNFEKIIGEERENLMYVRSFFLVTTNIQNRIIDRRSNKLNMKFIGRLNVILKRLILYLLGYDDDEEFINELDLSSLESEPIPKRQMIVRDYGIIDHLIDLCTLTYNLDAIALSMRAQVIITLRESFSLNYDCIRHAIAEYRPNELYCSQWLGLLIDDTFNNNKMNIESIEPTLKELIDNNRKILENRITDDIIEKFIGNITKERQAKYIELLNVLILCNGEPILMNQKRVTKILMGNEVYRDKILVLFHKKSNKDKILLHVSDEIEYQNISIEKLKDVSVKTDEGKTYRYVVKLIEFLSNLCYGQNYTAIYQLREKYDLENCVNIISNGLLQKNSEIRSAYANLVAKLWSSTGESHQRYLKRFYCKIWDEINDEENVELTDEFVSRNEIHLKKLWVSIKTHFEEQLGKAERNNYSNMNFSFTLSLIELSKDLLQNDIIAASNETKILRELVCRMLTNVFHYSEKNKDQDSKSKVLFSYFQKYPKNKVPFNQCKLKLIEIYRIILNFDFNSFINSLLFSLKDKSGSSKKSLVSNKKNLKGIKTEKNGFDLTNLIGKIKVKEEKGSLVKEIEEFIEITDQEEELVNSLLASSRESKEDLKIKSLDLLLTLFSKNEGLEDFINRLILIETGKESRIYSKLVDTTDLLERSKERFESNFENSRNEYKEFKKIIEALMHETKKKFLKKNEHAEILDYFDPSDRFHEILKVRLIKAFAHPSRLFQYLNHSLYVVELLIDILKLDKLTNTDIRNMPAEKEVIFKKFFEYLRLTSTDNKLIKNSVFGKIRNLFKLDITTTSFFPNYLYFLDEWAVDNDDVLEDQEIVKEIAKNILDYLIKSNNPSSPLSIFALSIIRKLIITKKMVYKENQNVIITMIFSQKYESLFSNFFGKKLKTFISEFQNTRQNFAEIKKAGSKKISITHPKIRFLSQYFLAVNACIADKNKFTENFCQNLYSPQILFDVIKNPKLTREDILLMHSITEYILESFILTDVCHKVSQIFIIQEVLDSLTNEFKVKIKTLLDESEDHYEMSDVIIVDEAGCRGYQYVLEDYLILLAKLFYHVVQLELPELSCEKFARQYEKFLDKLLKILKSKMNKFGNLLKESFIRLVSAIAGMKLVNNVGIVQKKAAREILDDLGVGRISAFNSFKKSFYNKHEGNEYSLQPISDQLLSIIRGKKITKRFEDHFETICQKLSSRYNGQDSESTLGSVGVDLLKTLVNQEDADKRYPKLYAFCLRLIRYYVEKKEIEFRDEEIENKNLKDNINRELIMRQNRLVDQDLVSILIDIIIKVKENSVLNETFLLMISLLKGGNTQVQQELSSCLLDLESNDFHAKMMELIRNETKQLNRLNKTLRERKLNNWFIMEGKLDEEAEDLHMIEEEQDRIEKHCNNTIKYFQVLQLFCEGHFNSLQNLLREQPKEQCKQSYNFYSISVELYGSLIKYLNENTTDLILQVLDFLTEAVQGPNKLNQEFLFGSKFFEFLKDYLNEYYDNKEIFKDEEKSGLIEQVIKKSINLVSGMLEGNTKRIELHEEIYKHIKIVPLMKMLGNRFSKYWEKFDKFLQNPKLETKYLKTIITQNVYDEEMQEMFQTFFFIKYQVDSLKHHYPNFWENLKNEHERQAYNFFEENSGSIELIFDDELELVYFIKQPASRYITDKEKKNFTNKVDRSSEKKKLSNLLQRSHRLIILMDYNMFVEKTGNPVIKISKTISTKLDTIILYYAFIVNILMLLLDNHNAEPTFGIPEDHWIFIISRYIMFILCFTRVGVSVAVDVPLILMEGWTQIFTAYRLFFIGRKEVKKESEKEEKERSEILHLINKDIRSISKNDRLKVISYVRKMQGYGETFSSFFYFMKCWEILASNFLLKYYIYTLGLSLLSLYYKRNIFFSLQLLDIIKQFEPLRNVIKSVTKNKAQLWLTCILLTICIFISSEFGFFYVMADFYMDSIFPNGEGTCSTMIHCFFTVFSLCARSSGGIGDVMSRESYSFPNRGHYFVRFFYDYLSFIIINIIGLNIFFGIILDTFSELRDERKTIEEDIKNRCFVCGKERFYFDRLAQGFEHHIKKDHNIWSYVRFIYYIKNKDLTDYNGIESFIYKNLQKESIDWFPRNQALCLEKNLMKKEEKTIDDILGALQNLEKSFDTTEQINFEQAGESIAVDSVMFSAFK